MVRQTQQLNVCVYVLLASPSVLGALSMLWLLFKNYCFTVACLKGCCF